MSEDEIKELKRVNGVLLQEKAEADRKWHDEVRNTLSQHGNKLLSIESSINSALKISDALQVLECRIKTIEDFKTKMIGWAVGANAVILVLWAVFTQWKK